MKTIYDPDPVTLRCLLVLEAIEGFGIGACLSLMAFALGYVVLGPLLGLPF